ncbi:MAG: glycosyltransferase family 2 protein [Phenylobacterium sp.]|nr:MAG: glycosyltransferase family 2 protein [Phenylobacterium sp.]
MEPADGRSPADVPGGRRVISVVVCTHNPRPDYFGQTLAALGAQSLSAREWELVVIDNASAEPLAGRIDLGWHPGARIVREDKLGLTPARLRGIREARGELLVFVDDDNVLDPNYLEKAKATADGRPYLGAWSGQCRPGFETTPPEWTRRYWGNLAVREFDHDVWSNLPRLGETMPCGAGLCVRRAVAERYLHLNETGQRAFQLDRTGGSLLSGGDNDLAACACELGLGVGLVADLRLQHLMSADRLTEDYLTRLAEGIHFSSTLLDAQWGLPVRRRGWARRAADFLRALRLPRPHRQIARAAYRGRDKAARLLETHGS